MARYDAYLFFHVVAAIVWLGGGLMLTLQALRANRAGQTPAIERILGDAEWLGTRVFVPASLVVLVFGILMVVDGPWAFDQLWIVLGLAGYAGTFVTGALISRPRANRIHAMMQRDGGMSPGAAAEAERLLVLARADIVLLYLVVAVMVIKPTGADVAVLGAMAAVLVGALTWVALRARAVELPSRPTVAGQAIVPPSGGAGLNLTDG